MIKKGSKVILSRPLKVLEVSEGECIKTVTVRVEFRGYYGSRHIQEVELPRSYVKEYKPNVKALKALNDLFNRCNTGINKHQNKELVKILLKSSEDEYNIVKKILENGGIK